jgi:hypothetical protein
MQKTRVPYPSLQPGKIPPQAAHNDNISLPPPHPPEQAAQGNKKRQPFEMKWVKERKERK